MSTSQFGPPIAPPPAPTAPPISPVRRLFNIVAGSFLIFIGALMIFIPGPGIAAILAGLNLIKPDNQISQYIRDRMEKRKQARDRKYPSPPPPPLT